MKELVRIHKTNQTLARGFDGCLNTYYGHTNHYAWKSNVEDMLLQAILNIPKLRKVAKYECASDFVRFFNACYGHANDYDYDYDYDYDIHRTGYVFSLLFVYLYCSIIFTPSDFIISVFLVAHQLRNGFLILIAASYGRCDRRQTNMNFSQYVSMSKGCFIVLNNLVSN
jgi:hypothetical protein